MRKALTASAGCVLLSDQKPTCFGSALLVTLDNVADRTVSAPATDHSSVCPINFRRYGIGLPRLSRVTGNQGSIPEREPEKRLPHPRKAARSATCRASTRVAAHSGDADETLLGRYVSDRRAVPFPLLGWGRRRSPLSMPAPVPAGGARAGSVGSRGPACHYAWRGAHGPGVGSESARSTRAYTNYAYKAKRSGQMCTHRRWWCL